MRLPIPDRQLRSGILRIVVCTAMLIVVSAGVAEACPYCYLASDQPAAQGVNNGIAVLLGVVGSVQLGFVALFVAVWRRGRRYRERKDLFGVIDGGRP